MAYEIGTATDYTDLLAKLKTFVTTNADLVAAGQEWTMVREDTIDEVIFKAPGLSTTEEIYLGFRRIENIGTGLYTYDIAGFTGYSSSASFDNQPGRVATKDTYFPGWQNSTPYWFIANGQRVVIVAKVNTRYMSMYLGKFLPYGTPNQYPYPVMSLGMTNSNSAIYSSTLNRAMGTGTNYGTLYLPSGVLVTINSGALATATSCQVHPLGGPANLYSVANYCSFAKFDSGEVNLVNLTIMFGAYYAEKALLGEYDGVFYVTGDGMSSETIVTVNAVDYLVFQDAGLTGRMNYFAVRLA